MSKTANETGRCLGDIISEAVLATLARPSVPFYDLPTSGEGGLQPGVDVNNSAELQDVIDHLR